MRDDKCEFRRCVLCRAKRRSREQDRPEVQEQRREFCAKLAGLDPRRLVFVDESGANTAMTRTHGRAPVGQRVYTNTPGRWESITLTCGLRLSAVTAPLAFSGATHTDIFESYVEEVLVPDLKPRNFIGHHRPVAMPSRYSFRNSHREPTRGLAPCRTEQLTQNRPSPHRA